MLIARWWLLFACLALVPSAGAAVDEGSKPADFCPASRARMEYGLDLTTRAYLKVGHHDKAWDNDALRAIAALARSWHEFPRLNGDENDVGFHAGADAIANGCDDPLLIFAHARASAQFGFPVSDIVALDKRAVEGFRASKYPPTLVVSAMLRWANDTARAAPKDDAALKEARKHFDEAMDLLPRALADPRISLFAVVDLLEVISITSGHIEGDRGAYITRALPVFEASPVPPAVILAAKANAYYLWASDARGSGTVDTVDADTWPKITANLKEASADAHKALELDPQNSEAARVLDYIELYEPSPPEQHDAAFDLAVKLDPDDQRLYHAHLIDLLPQWHGSIEQMLTYGRACAKDYKGKGLGALALTEAHWLAAYYAVGPEGSRLERAYFEKSPEIFDEVKPIYDAYFKTPDASNFHKTRYAVIAAYCGHWKEADAMFKALGENRSLYLLYRAEPLDALIKETAEKAKAN